jgi:predicted negative regulator of RcsB-dependent stress response
MRYVFKVTSALIFSLTLVTPALAQDNKRKSPEAAKKKIGAAESTLTPNQQSALYALDQLLSAAKTFDDDRLKIRTQAQVADLLWSHDEQRSRRLFEEVFRAVASAKLPEQDGSSFPGMPSPTPSPLLSLQTEILALVARRDPDLAEKLINSTRESSSDKDSSSNQQTEAGKGRQPEMYLQAALSIAKTDPERAVQLARAGLAGGLNPTVLRVLLTLRQSNGALADGLFRDALSVARRDLKTAPANISLLASYALPEFVTGAFDAEGGANVAAQSGSPAVTEFLNFAFVTYMQLSGTAAQFGVPTGGITPPATPNPVALMTGQRLLPSFTRYMPDKAAMFRQALDAMARNVPQGAGAEITKMFQPASASDLVEQAKSEKYAPLRDLLYLRAAVSAISSGEFDQALSIADKIEDKERRAGFSSIIRSQAASSLIKKNDVDAALRFARGVEDMRQRALLFAKIARALLDKKDAQRAGDVLGEAEQAVSKADDGEEKAYALLTITEVKSRLDPAQGFSAMEATIKAFNRADSNKGDKGQGGVVSGSPSLAILNSMLKPEAPSLEPSFLRLAKADFDRTMQLAQTFERKDRSVLAQLATCRAVLISNRER